MNELQTEVGRMADEAFEMMKTLTGTAPDFSRASLPLVEATLGQASSEVGGLGDDRITKMIQRLGCYVLEVARREWGGTYRWFPDAEQPMLVIEDGERHLAMLGWERVRGRLAGDANDNIALYFQAVEEKIRDAQPGARAVFA